MTDTRHRITDVLFTAAILGVGLLSGNPILASVVADIGVNLASDLMRAGWGPVCQRLLGESGLRNHDLQQAMLRADWTLLWTEIQIDRRICDRVVLRPAAM